MSVEGNPYIGSASILAVLLCYLLGTTSPGPRRLAATLVAGSLFLWLAAENLVASGTSAGLADPAIRFTYAALACIPLAMARLIATLDDPEAPRHRWSMIGTACFAGATLLLLTTDLVISGITPEHGGQRAQSGPLFPSFAFVLFVLLAVDLAMAVQVSRRARHVAHRVRCQYLLLGLAAAVALGIADVGILQPLGIRGHRVLTVPLEVTVGMGSLVYAVVRTRLVHVATALRRTMLHATLVATLLVPCLGLSLLAEQYFTGGMQPESAVVTALLFCVAGFVFPRLRVGAEQRLEHVLFGARADHRELLHRASREVTSLLSLSTLAGVTRDTLAQAFGEAEATLWLRQEDRLVAVDRTDEDAPPFDAATLALLERTSEPIVLSEVDATDPAAVLTAPLLERRIELAVVLRVKRRLVGVLTLGRRSDDELYGDDDIGLVMTLANQVAVALENARLYEELRQSREEVHHATRLSAVGTLAAGVAHEIRNPLVAVRTFLQLCPKRLEDHEFLRTFSSLALAEAQRIERLITDLLTFARGHERTLEDLDLGAVVTQVRSLLEPHATKRSVSLAVVVPPRLPAVHGDAGQLKQVLLNIVLNAIDASPESGEVTVRTQPARGADGERQVRLDVVDQGPGISPEHLDLLFTPFFTTKETGTGLGLAVAHQLVAEHGGTLVASATPGGGATFTVTLPAAAPGRTAARAA